MNNSWKSGTIAACGLLMLAAARLPAAGTDAPAPPAAAPVTVSEDDAAFTLDNGLVTARVNKTTGDLVSLVYKGVETLGANSGHPFAYWSHDARSPQTVATVTIDPRTNDGARAEVSVKGNSSGRAMGRGPGGSFISDIEIRYTMDRGMAGVYTYCAFDHPEAYPAAVLGEARFCAKLAPTFDWLYASPTRNLHYPPEKELTDDKYNYTLVQFDHPAFGWTSTTDKIGVWCINPSIEYLSGGSTKVEFLVHRDTARPVFAACILNYWRGSHYGGSAVDVAAGEKWTKVVGPFLLYCNSGPDPDAMYQNAMVQAATEIKSWPYGWVSGVDYPAASGRGTVTGQIVLSDPRAPAPADNFTKLLVGVAPPDYAPPTGRAGQGNWTTVDWQLDAKYYQFWARGEKDGKFAIPHVRPGKYTLHAIADSVLGEYAKADITVEAGKTVDLGKLTWTPVRRGRQVWEIGVPNRTGEEFFKGDEHNRGGTALVYRDLFPNDVDYTVGKSDYAKDWHFSHVPHVEDPNARPSTIMGANSQGRANTWTINFAMPAAGKGLATLRLGIAGASGAPLALELNGQPLATVRDVKYNATINRNGIGGYWVEREVPFDAALLKSGENTLTLTIPAGSATSGFIYDYLRLELDESAAPPATTSAPAPAVASAAN